MRTHLTHDVNAADYIVDLSNVLRNSRLGGDHAVDVGRLAVAYRPLTIMDGSEDLLWYLVADRSLLSEGLFGPDLDGLRTLREWRDRGLLEVVGEADERILELSTLTGIRILSNDLFRGWRGQFTWLQGNSDRVVKLISTDGGLEARRSELAHLSTAETSKFQERDELKYKGLLTGDRRRPRFDVMDRLWSCPAAGCHDYDGLGRSVMPPRVRDDVVMCERHRQRLTDAGPRPLTVPLKIVVDGACARRFALPADEPVTVGRAPGPGGIDLTAWLGAEVATSSLSRVHVRLRLAGERLLARDLSSYGTGLRRTGTSRNELLERDVDYVLRSGDVLVLSRRVTIVRSGRSFASELAADWPVSDGTANGAPPTRPVSVADPGAWDDPDVSGI